MSADQHSKGRPRRFVWNAVILGTVGCLIGVGNLYRVQEEYKDCVTDFFTGESIARKVRTDASAAQSKALREAFDETAELLDPNRKTKATLKDIVDLQVKYVRYGATADRYEATVENYPYLNFKKECG